MANGRPGAIGGNVARAGLSVPSPQEKWLDATAIVHVDYYRRIAVAPTLKYLAIRQWYKADARQFKQVNLNGFDGRIARGGDVASVGLPVDSFVNWHDLFVCGADVGIMELRQEAFSRWGPFDHVRMSQGCFG